MESRCFDSPCPCASEVVSCDFLTLAPVNETPELFRNTTKVSTRMIFLQFRLSLFLTRKKCFDICQDFAIGRLGQELSVEPGFLRVDRSCFRFPTLCKIEFFDQRATFCSNDPTNQRDGPQEQHPRCDSPGRAMTANTLRRRTFQLRHKNCLFGGGSVRPQALILHCENLAYHHQNHIY